MMASFPPKICLNKVNDKGFRVIQLKEVWWWIWYLWEGEFFLYKKGSIFGDPCGWWISCFSLHSWDDCMRRTMWQLGEKLSQFGEYKLRKRLKFWRIQTEEEIEILENTNWGRYWNFGEYKLRKILKFWRIKTEKEIEILENTNWERNWKWRIDMETWT